jgi:streptogramin lyase
VDASGNLLVVDYANHRIRLISLTPACVVSTLAGSGAAGYRDGITSVAQFSGPTDVSIDSSGRVYVSDAGNNAIRTVYSGLVSTFSVGHWNSPQGLAAREDGSVFVSDSGNNLISLINPDLTVVTVAGSGAAAYKDGSGTAAAFLYPTTIRLSPDSSYLVVADTNNNRIRSVNLSTALYQVSTVSGASYAGYSNGGGDMFSTPLAVVVDSVGNVFIADKQA